MKKIWEMAKSFNTEAKALPDGENEK